MIRYRYLLTLILFSGCQSFVEVGPPKTESVSASVYNDDVTATAAVRAVYHEMVRGGFASGQSVSVTCLGGASADDFVSFTTTIDEFQTNNILITSVSNLSVWSTAYKTIYYCNSVIEGLQESTAVSKGVKTQLTGEVKFLRAFTYFYLLNLYGSIPLVTTTDYRVNAIKTRTGYGDVMNQIIGDLSEAQQTLPADFQFAGGERVRVTSWAASALLARAYLFNKEWAKAEQQATLVISQTGLFGILSDLNTVFLKNSQEAIWQLMPVTPGQNTNEGIAFVPPSATSLPPNVSLTTSLMSSFETGDKRRVSWTGNQTVGATTYYYPFKYKVRTVVALTEYSMVLRLAEQYLIRAEARVQQGKFTEAMTDMDVIRSRAGLTSVQNIVGVPTISNLLLAIERERRVELFSEWGHRWFDLKRWDRANDLLQPVKANWSSGDVLYPVPQSEIAVNPNLNPQNPGY